MKNFKKPQLSRVFAAMFLFCVVAGIGFASAATMSSYYDVNIPMINDAKFNATGEYNFFNPGQIQGGGLNALHIAPNNSTPFGSVTNTTSTSGTFYLSDTGGGKWFDDGVLMIAVNATPAQLQSSGFSVNIASNGYNWTPVASGSYPYFNNSNYIQGISQTFTASDFNSTNYAYSQNWRPSTYEGYGIYEGQPANSGNFSIIFVDLKTGIVNGTSIASQYGWANAVDKGMLKVNYNINNIPSGSLVAFDAYAFCQNSPQGTGVRWTNAVNLDGNRTTGTSGYFVRNY